MVDMITTREFLNMMLKTLLITLKAFIQYKEKNQINIFFEPFPSKEELLDKYEAGLDAPYEDLSLEIISSITPICI